MDNIVFLDIDGCIRTGIGDEESGTSHLVVFDRKFCVKSVSALNYISNVTRCKFVISSTWRTHYKIEDLREIFRKNGLYIDVIGYTEVLGEGRG